MQTAFALWALYLWIGLGLCFSVAKLIFLFFHHPLPDSSTYVLFAWDEINGFPRFTYHVDPKGPAWHYLYTLFVALLGPHQTAVAVLQSTLSLLAMLFTYWGFRTFLTPLLSLAGAVTFLLLALPQLFWGANARPEDWQLLAKSVTFWAVVSHSGGAGCLAGMIFLAKFPRCYRFFL